MKKFLKRLLLILFAILVAIQAPFIYRRYKVGKLAAKVADLNAGRSTRIDGRFREYKGIIHAHTNLGGHSTGGFDELIAAANANDLDFVIMTEHWSDTVDTAAMTLNGVYGKTLFIGGNEIDTADSDRFLMIPGSAEAASLRRLPTTAVIDKLHAENRLALVTYPEKLNSWDANFDGIEVFSLHTNAKAMNPFTAIFDAIWSYSAYPELMLASYFKRPDENLRKFDEIAARKKISLFAGTDAHSNIGFHLFGDDAGNKGLNVKLDKYEAVFRLARQHVLIENDKPLTMENLIHAIKKGRSYIGFDVLAETRGFEYSAINGDGGTAIQGEELAFGSNTILRASLKWPFVVRFVLYRNGEIYASSANMYSNELEATVREPGVYRVEGFLDHLGPPFDKMPWIISNPIYVR